MTQTGVPAVLTLPLTALLALGSSAADAEQNLAPCGSGIASMEVNGARLHYFECGAGEPLVFVHGGLGGLHTFRAQAQTFAASFRVIAYSRRFHLPNAPAGAAEANPLSVHVADLGALLTRLKAAPARLVGNSYGAYIALALAIERPELVRSLVLAEPPILPLLSRTSVGEAARQSWVRRILEPSRKAFEGGSLEDGLRRMIDGLCGRPGCFDSLPAAERASMVEKQAPELRSELMTDLSAYLPALECDRLATVKRPMLLVSGERSPSIFPLITAELERCVEGESHVMVPEAGHSMHRENAVFYNQAVAAFLQRH